MHRTPFGDLAQPVVGHAIGRQHDPHAGAQRPRWDVIGRVEDAAVVGLALDDDFEAAQHDTLFRGSHPDQRRDAGGVAGAQEPARGRCLFAPADARGHVSYECGSAWTLHADEQTRLQPCSGGRIGVPRVVRMSSQVLARGAYGISDGGGWLGHWPFPFGWLDPCILNFGGRSGAYHRGMTDVSRVAATGARYGHTNLIARDWRTVAEFYERIFGCAPVPPERNYSGPDLERGTGVPGATLSGIHLRLPGHGAAGPTLEIYTYGQQAAALPPAANRPGWGHLAFAVHDVAQARQAVLSVGGGTLGEIVTLHTADGRRVTWCYVSDPEGNIVELQSWAPAA